MTKLATISRMAKATKRVLPVRFPKRFLWGAATSAHQVEGGTHNQWSVWELENAKSLAKQAEYKLNELPAWQGIKDKAMDPGNYISGRAADHYNRYEQDFDLLGGLNMNSFRFSIEWSRLEPKEGEWDPSAMDHYKKYLKALKKRNIEPLVTLMHWSLPEWFAKKGGFEKRRNIKYFVRFAEKVLEELGQDFRYVCTLNEPEAYVYGGWVEGVWPPSKAKPALALWVYFNLAYAHRKIYRLAKRTSRHFKVGLSKDVAHHYPSDSDNSFATKLTIWTNIYISDYLFLSSIKRQLDWLGLNYYYSHRYSGYARVPTSAPVNDLGWEMKPQDILPVLKRLHQKYKKPIIITESGVADHKDQYRKWWITHTLIAMHKAIESGVDIRGYLHWSLLDNFEWAYGKWPNFGLIEVDYKSFKRSLKPSAIWYGKLLKQLRGL